MNWYVLFVKAGYEQKLTKEISNFWRIDGLKPFVPMYDARFKRAGRVYAEKRRLFPGYIFLESGLKGMEFYMTIKPLANRSEHSLKLLRYGGDYEGGYSFEMNKEEQLTFLQLYNKDYCVEMSQGFIDGDSVVITDGPLGGFESRIKKINRHRMEALVEIEMMGRLTEVKVGLEVIKKLP